MIYGITTRLPQTPVQEISIKYMRVGLAWRLKIILQFFSAYPASVLSSHEKKDRTEETFADNQDQTYLDARRWQVKMCWRFKEHKPVILESPTTGQGSPNLLLQHCNLMTPPVTWNRGTLTRHFELLKEVEASEFLDIDGGADDDGQLMTWLLSPGLIYTLLTLTSPNDTAYLTKLTSYYLS